MRMTLKYRLIPLLLLLLLAGSACSDSEYKIFVETDEDIPGFPGDMDIVDGDADLVESEVSEDADGDIDGEDIVEQESEVLDPYTDWLSRELLAREKFTATPISLSGRVLDSSGKSVSGATVIVDEYETTTDSLGSFSFPVLSRHNAVLKTEAPGYRTSNVIAHLFQPLSVDRLQLQPIIIDKDDPQVVRFMFGGDAAFGRRFVDPDESIPRDQLYLDDEFAIIQASQPFEGAKQVVGNVRHYFEEVDYPVLNLESAITDNPVTPQTEKDYVYYTLPGALPILAWLDVEYVSLGNNHVYDYQDQGIADSLVNLDDGGYMYSGAGLDSEEAFKPYRTTIKGHPYSFLSMTSVSGSQYTTSFVATEDKGGAADLRRASNVEEAVVSELEENRIPIAQLHTGKEYTNWPSDYARSKMYQVVEDGAALLVCHHPHVAQGFEVYEDIFIIHNLGNLFFDQQRLETFQAVLTQVDMKGSQVLRKRALPIYLEDYLTRSVTGRMADRLLRRLGEFSDNVQLFPYLGQGWISADESEYKVIDRQVTASVIVGEDGFAVVDLLEYAGTEESLLNASIVEGQAQAWIGRDILTYGDFEDLDADSDLMEARRWNTNEETRFACVGESYRGAQALCLLRLEENVYDAVAAFKNRIRVWGDALSDPNKRLTLFGYAKAQNAGDSAIVVRYYASEGPLMFGEEIGYYSYAGTYDWLPFATDLSMPEDTTQLAMGKFINPRALRLFLRHSPPDTGNALMAYDELALIGWEEELALDGSQELKCPHARDHLRIEADPGQYEIELTFRSYVPSVI